jgi:hypothetical protein
MFGPMTITMFDASDRKILLGCKKSYESDLKGRKTRKLRQ